MDGQYKDSAHLDDELISVAMCTYNGEKYLAEQLDSILGQSYRNLEIIIVDDCSTDNTVKLLTDYASRDSRVCVLQNESNLGFVRNFEKAINSCSGHLVALADQDDIWFPDKLRRLSEDIGDNWLIYSKVAVVDANGVEQNETFPRVNRLEGQCALSLIMNNCVTGHACLMRCELLQVAMPFISDMPYHDQWLAIVAASRGKLKAGDEVLSYYRKHSSNAVMRSKTKRNISKREHVVSKFKAVSEFVEKVLKSGILNRSEQYLLEEFSEKYIKNERVFYNFELKHFLLKHSDTFLGLFNGRKRYIKKMCRGKWYFILLPFS